MEPETHINRVRGGVMDAAADMTILEQVVRDHPLGDLSQEERDWAAARADRLVQTAKFIRDVLSDPDWRGEDPPTAEGVDYSAGGGIGDLA